MSKTTAKFHTYLIVKFLTEPPLGDYTHDSLGQELSMTLVPCLYPFLFVIYKPSNMYQGQGSVASISKQEPCSILILTYVTLQIKTFPTMYLAWLYNKV